jgi:hypothetical protein
MDYSGIEEFLEKLFSNSFTRKKLDKYEMSEKELKVFMEGLVKSNETKIYNRILAEDERRAITPEAFGYLVELLSLKSIDKNLFENVISLSMQLHVFLKRKIDKRMMDDIVNFLIFSGRGEVTIRDILEILFVQDSDLIFNEDIN